MSTTPAVYRLPPPQQVRERIAAAEEELRALRHLLRASLAAMKAEEARQRREDPRHPERGRGAR